MRRLTLLLLCLLLVGCARGAPSGPTPAPGEATGTPTAVGTFQARQRPTATPTPPLATPTARPTPEPATPGQWTRYALPTEQVCGPLAQRELIEPKYAMTHVRLDFILFRLEANPDWLADQDFLDDVKAVGRRIERLEIRPCSVKAQALMMQQVADMIAAFALWPHDQGSALVALGNARSVSTQFFMWNIGEQPWRPVPILH